MLALPLLLNRLRGLRKAIGSLMPNESEQELSALASRARLIR